MAYSNHKKGINFDKFILYTITNILLFVLCLTLLLFFNKILDVNLRLSNMISDTVGLIILFFISKKFIFFQNKKRDFIKIIYFFSARYITIIIFSILIIEFITLANFIQNIFALNFTENQVIIFSKILMIPFSVIVNFLITYATIEKIENFLR